jgi:D-glycero-alpha-D-manno-heptose-7-phosphate kinase
MSLITVKVPFRIPIGGGGTDLPSYCSKFGGQLITASINKYIYIIINEPAISDKIKLHYIDSESVSDTSEIKHDIIRECLKLKKINRPLDISSLADIGRGTGMGSSSAFTVGLLAALNTLERKYISPVELAEEACKIEIDILKKPIGKQDQYATALGGINELIIDTSGKVTVNPLKLDKEVIFELENRLMMFSTGVTRDANEVLKEQGKNIKQSFDTMHEIKKIGIDIKNDLCHGRLDSFGLNLDRHWRVKKTMTSKMSSEMINNYYRIALENGALGGKIMGAGGGGLFLFYTNNRSSLMKAMLSEGLRYMDFRFEFEGAKIIVNI